MFYIRYLLFATHTHTQFGWFLWLLFIYWIQFLLLFSYQIHGIFFIPFFFLFVFIRKSMMHKYSSFHFFFFIEIIFFSTWRFLIGTFTFVSFFFQFRRRRLKFITHRGGFLLGFLFGFISLPNFFCFFLKIIITFIVYERDRIM